LTAQPKRDKKESSKTKEGSKMTQREDELKQKMKDEYAKKVDEYFSEIAEMKENGNFSINDIEKLLGNGITAAKEVLTATTEEIIKPEPDTDTIKDSKKKRVPSAKKP
jgi:lipoate-protein ligase A